jgi:hypothetical protein
MKIRAHRIAGNERVVPGDLLKVKGNQKLVPAVMVIGFLAGEIEKAVGEDLEGIYRPSEEVRH